MPENGSSKGRNTALSDVFVPQIRFQGMLANKVSPPQRTNVVIPGSFSLLSWHICTVSPVYQFKNRRFAWARSPPKWVHLPEQQMHLICLTFTWKWKQIFGLSPWNRKRIRPEYGLDCLILSRLAQQRPHSGLQTAHPASCLTGNLSLSLSLSLTLALTLCRSLFLCLRLSLFLSLSPALSLSLSFLSVSL